MTRRAARRIGLLCTLLGTALGSEAFNTSEAAVALGYAQATYCDKGDLNNLRNWSCGKVCSSVPPLRNVTVVEDAGTSGLVYVGWQPDANIVLVAFRGTVILDWRNWLTDIESITLVDASTVCGAANCLVGNGFLKAYMAVRDGVLGALEPLLAAHPSAALHVTGHSLGAALATVHVLDLRFRRNTTVHASTNFGCPRVGNAALAQAYEGSVGEGRRWRVTHHRDPVIHVPIKATGFQHTSREAFFPDVSGLSHKLCDGSGEDPGCSYGYTPEPLATDHLNYLDVPLGTYAC